MKKLFAILICLSMSAALANTAFAGYSSGGRSGGFSGGRSSFSSGRSYSSYSGSRSYASNYSAGGRSGYVSSPSRSYARPSYNTSSYSGNTYRASSTPHTTVINNTTHHGSSGGFGGGGFWSGMLGGYMGASMAQPHMYGGVAPVYGQPGYAGGNVIPVGDAAIAAPIMAQPYGYSYSFLPGLLTLFFIIIFIALFFYWLMHRDDCH